MAPNDLVFLEATWSSQYGADDVVTASRPAVAAVVAAIAADYAMSLRTVPGARSCPCLPPRNAPMHPTVAATNSGGRFAVVKISARLLGRNFHGLHGWTDRDGGRETVAYPSARR